MTHFRTTGFSLSVVIPTHNRAQLVCRAVQSVLNQGWPGIEIVIVDDGSRDATATAIRRLFPVARYLRHETPLGPGPARQHGLEAASGEWVVLLDDDDELAPGAIDIIAETIRRWPGIVDVPVLQFACAPSAIEGDFLLARLDDYLCGNVRGDCTPVVHRRRFLEAGLAYPATRLGGEHILWWQVAARFGLPTWNRGIAVVHNDAPGRLTSCIKQIERAAEHATLQELSLRTLVELAGPGHALVSKKHVGVATYWLLDGQRQKAWDHLKAAFAAGSCPTASILFALSVLPTPVFRALFRAFRKFTVRSQQPAAPTANPTLQAISVPDYRSSKAA